jgi:hypothetical protein
VPDAAEEIALGDRRHGGGFQPVDPREQVHQMPHLRLAVLRHAGVEVSTHPLAVQQHVAQAVRRELGPDVIQGRRQPPRITEIRFGAREQSCTLREDPADP